VKPVGPDSLEALLQRHRVARIDLLSIDIDSDDLAIWESVVVYSPAIVIIEYNPTIPFDTRYRNPSGAFHGNSALSIFELATRRSYVLAAGTDTNLIFVRRDAWEGTSLPARTLQDVCDNTFQLRYFFSQDGMLLHNYELFSRAGVTELYPVPWAFTISTQPVLKLLRRRSDRINPAIVAFSLLVAAVRCPWQLLKLVVYFTRTATRGRSYVEIASLMTKKSKLTSLLKRGT
jgi:hypothetical protein